MGYGTEDCSRWLTGAHGTLSRSITFNLIGDQHEISFLTLPEHCSTTIRNAGLSDLDSAINRTDIWDDLDGSANYTCLGPTNGAFTSAGHPEDNLNESALASVMHMHTIPQVLYTTFLQDGQ